VLSRYANSTSPDTPLTQPSHSLNQNYSTMQQYKNSTLIQQRPRSTFFLSWYNSHRFTSFASENSTVPPINLYPRDEQTAWEPSRPNNVLYNCQLHITVSSVHPSTHTYIHTHTYTHTYIQFSTQRLGPKVLPSVNVPDKFLFFIFPSALGYISNKSHNNFSLLFSLVSRCLVM
jgi:hypothetical protein